MTLLCTGCNSRHHWRMGHPSTIPSTNRCCIHFGRERLLFQGAKRWKIHKTNLFSEERLLHVEGGRRSPHLPLWGLIHFKSNLENSKLTWSRKYQIWNFLFDPSPIIAMSCQSVIESVKPLLNLAVIVGFVKVVKWISLSFYLDLSKFIHGFL